jgi:glycosyltransferase involved in cell wall biosynthesis
MKILHCLYDEINNPWVGGGGALRLIELYKRFPKDVEIELISGRYPGAQDWQRENIRMRYLGTDRKHYMWSRVSYSMAARRFIRKNQHEYDWVIEDFSPFSPLFIHNLVPAERRILQMQNYIGRENHLRKFPFLGRLTHWIEDHSVRQNRRFIFSSPDLQMQVKDVFGEIVQESIPVYNGVQEELFRSNEITAESEKFVLFLGRLDKYQKGVDFLFERLAELQDLNDLQVKICGEGPDEHDLRRLATQLNLSGCLSWEGRVEAKRKETLLSTAHFVVMPSRFESWGIVSIEAQASSTPVLARDILGLRTTLTNGVEGLLFQGADDFLLKFRNLWNDNDLRKKLSKNGPKNAKKYLWQAQSDHMAGFLFRQ